ncbi:metallophosphoesterase [Christensenellaceae bacterium OttesenSCG-928-M15]|nr:metallophosphoesterase [Christensenellaceae bacterium OttesenSCG-928-M15]
MIRARKSVFVILSLLGLLAVTAYLYFQFSKLIMNLITANPGLVGPFFFVLPSALAITLVSVSAYKRSMLMGFVIYLGVFYLITDLVRVIARIFVYDTDFFSYLETSGFFALLPIMLALILCLYGYYNAKRIRPTHYSVHTGKLDGTLRIAMISDLHLGAGMKAADLHKLVAITNAQAPNMILLCGDIFEEKTDMPLALEAMRICRGFHAEQGVYYVPGNHEFKWLKQNNLTLRSLRDILAQGGVEMLCDETLFVDDRLYLVGRNDSAGKTRAPLESLLTSIDKTHPVVVMDHKPAGLHEVANLEVDLQLSGHTHAGQLFHVGRLGEWYGHSDLMYGRRDEGNYTAIVSSGAGTWGFPIRVGSPSEVVVVDLQ